MNILVPENAEMDFSEVLTMSESATFIWEKLQSECSFEDVLNAMKAEFDVSEDVLRADLTEFLGQLEEKGLLDK